MVGVLWRCHQSVNGLSTRSFSVLDMVADSVGVAVIFLYSYDA